MEARPFDDKDSLLEHSSSAAGCVPNESNVLRSQKASPSPTGSGSEAAAFGPATSPPAKHDTNFTAVIAIGNDHDHDHDLDRHRQQQSHQPEPPMSPPGVLRESDADILERGIVDSFGSSPPGTPPGDDQQEETSSSSAAASAVSSSPTPWTEASLRWGAAAAAALRHRKMMLSRLPSPPSGNEGETTEERQTTVGSSGGSNERDLLRVNDPTARYPSDLYRPSRPALRRRCLSGDDDIDAEGGDQSMTTPGDSSGEEPLQDPFGKKKGGDRTEGSSSSESSPTCDAAGSQADGRAVAGIASIRRDEVGSRSLPMIHESLPARFSASEHANSLPLELSASSLHGDDDESMAMQRSKSADRLLQEAAQYSEAVGELPPTEICEISREIIDDDGEYDDDDEDEDEEEEEEEGEGCQEETASCTQVERNEAKSSFKNPATGQNENGQLALHEQKENRCLGSDTLSPTGDDDKCVGLCNRRGKKVGGQDERDPLNHSNHKSDPCDPDCLIAAAQLRRPRSNSVPPNETPSALKKEMGRIPSSSSVVEARDEEQSQNTPVSKRKVSILLEKNSSGRLGHDSFHNDDSSVVTVEGEEEKKSTEGSTNFMKRSASCPSVRDIGLRTMLTKHVLHPLKDSHGADSATTFTYRGIKYNPPEITKRGISRGNYAQLHRKAWLEVSDKYHRYGKNLRMYYKHWESLGHPHNMFFDWLDSKGEAAGHALPNLPECPRSQLDSDTVLYITNPEVQTRYELNILTSEEDHSALVQDTNSLPVGTGNDGWIFVLRDGKVYAAPKIASTTGKAKKRFHHSSFFGGKAVAAAGIFITNDEGRLTRLYPHSGHYRPGEAHMQRMLFFLQQLGIDLQTFDVDMQQIYHMSRKELVPKGGKTVDGAETTARKAKKTSSLYLKPASFVACYLAHKAHMIGEGVFAQIHKIRACRAASVKEALDAVDKGGYWQQMLRLDSHAVE